MNAKPKTVKGYLASLAPERRAALEAVRKVILDNLGPGYEEGLQYGMIGYYVSRKMFPAGYHCDPSQPLPFAGLASRAGYMTVALGMVYGNTEHAAWFRRTWAKTGKKLDMGVACIRFRKVEDLPLEVIGEAVRRVPAEEYIAGYVAARAKAGGGKRPAVRGSRRRTSAGSR